MSQLPLMEELALPWSLAAQGCGLVGKGAQDSRAGELLTLLRSSELRQELEDENQQAKQHSLSCPRRHYWSGSAALQ